MASIFYPVAFMLLLLNFAVPVTVGVVAQLLCRRRLRTSWPPEPICTRRLNQEKQETRASLRVRKSSARVRIKG